MPEAIHTAVNLLNSKNEYFGLLRVTVSKDSLERKRQ